MNKKKDVEKEQFQMKKHMKEEVKMGMMEAWHTHQPGRTSRIGIKCPQLHPTLQWNEISLQRRGDGWNTWLWSCSSIWSLGFNRRRIQTQCVPAGKDREWWVSLQGVEMHQQGRRICQSWAYLWFSLKSTVSWRKVSDCWIWGCRGQARLSWLWWKGLGWIWGLVLFSSSQSHFNSLVVWWRVAWTDCSVSAGDSVSCKVPWCEGEAPESLPGLGSPCSVLQNTKFQVSQSSMCMAGNSHFWMSPEQEVALD